MDGKGEIGNHGSNGHKQGKGDNKIDWQEKNNSKCQLCQREGQLLKYNGPSARVIHL